MKHFYFLLACLIFNINIQAQEYVEYISYVSDDVVEQTFGLPVVRSVYGGTKIIPEFEGNWTNEMKGAFEYACKIWEEAMPSTFPIRIKAILDETTTSYQDKPVFSRITMLSRSHTSDHINGNPFTNVSTYLQIKGTKFHEFSDKSDSQLYDSVLSINMFTEPDITIRYYNYNNKLIDNCSFSIEDEVDNNHYDFVTLALRDIAKSFGIMWTNKIIRNPETLTYNRDRFIPFERWIADALNADNNPHLAYQNATKGSLTIGDQYDHFTLYAPTEWDTERSLNYFIPDEENKITRLLTYDFGRGTLIRDISCVNNKNFFENLLRWKGEIGVGTGGTSGRDNPFNTENTISYKGNISLKSPTMSLATRQMTKRNKQITQSDIINDELQTYINKFHPNYDKEGNIDNNGWKVALLKKDGTWDIVYSASEAIGTLDVNTSDFTLHENVENYARSCDGYLRCRITDTRYSSQTRGITSNSYYYLLDYLPQQVEAKMSKVMPYETEESYYRDVQIGLKNIEGATKIVVSQLDEGNELPYSYEVQNFKKGYFTATVDKDFASTFTITAYNNNGSTVSKPYILQPLSSTLEINDIKFINKNNSISIKSNNPRFANKDIFTSYKIIPIATNTLNDINTFGVVENNTIDISSISDGYHILIINDIKGGKHTFKFLKR